MNIISEIVQSVIARGDLAHLALALWAGTDVAVLVLLLRELGAANRRFDEFVRELSRFNGRHETGQGGPPNATSIQQDITATGPVIQNTIHQQMRSE